MKQRVSRKTVLAVGDNAATTEIWLMGQPPLHLYLSHVKEMVIGGNKIPPSALVDQWRKANDYYGHLEKSEAGIADKIDTFPLDPTLQKLAAKMRRTAVFKRTFDTLPTRIEMVELDQLVVGHPYVNKDHLEKLKSTIGRSASMTEQFAFCQPMEPKKAPIEVRQTGSRRFTFWSPSTDFRFQESTLLRPEQILGHSPMGAIGNAVALLVGFGPNFLSLIQYGSRYVLHNGHHRAVALRELGYTHAPCIVETVTRIDELKLVAQPAIADDPAFYFQAPRPPILKDFFDNRIRTELRVHRPINAIEVSFDVKELNQVRDFNTQSPENGNRQG